MAHVSSGASPLPDLHIATLCRYLAAAPVEEGSCHRSVGVPEGIHWGGGGALCEVCRVWLPGAEGHSHAPVSGIITYIAIHYDHRVYVISCSDDQKQYLLDIGIFADLQSILDSCIHDASVITEAFCVIACLSDMCTLRAAQLCGE